MAKVLLVCSGGGHLKQLFSLVARAGIPVEDQLWSTFDNALSRSLLEGREVEYMHYAAPRDARPILRNIAVAHRIMRRNDISAVISTGSSPAVSFFVIAYLHRIPRHYIESAARAGGPSLSGRIVARIRGTHTYSQYPIWATDRWKYRGSMFDCFEPGEANSDQPVTRAVVSLGTQETYPFPRLFDSVVPLLANMDVLWQVGGTDVSSYGITGHKSVLHNELQAAVARADVVIAHSGTGAAVTALEAGKCPILIPRLARYGEHVDDHQVQIAEELHRRGLAIMARPEEVTPELIAEAARRTVRVIANPPAVDLGLALGAA